MTRIPHRAKNRNVKGEASDVASDAETDNDKTEASGETELKDAQLVKGQFQLLMEA
jgi:hypothetical protein